MDLLGPVTRVKKKERGLRARSIPPAMDKMAEKSERPTGGT